MNKKISKFVSCVLAVTLFMSLLTVTAFAAESNYDLNGDGKVSVSDVTALQLRISGNRSNWTDAYEKRADINGDGKIDINDVTALQNILMNASSGGTSSGASAANSFLIKLPSASSRYFLTIPISPLSLGPKVLRLGFALNDKFSNSAAVNTSLVFDWSLIISCNSSIALRTSSS